MLNPLSIFLPSFLQWTYIVVSMLSCRCNCKIYLSLCSVMKCFSCVYFSSFPYISLIWHYIKNYCDILFHGYLVKLGCSKADCLELSMLWYFQMQAVTWPISRPQPGRTGTRGSWTGPSPGWPRLGRERPSSCLPPWTRPRSIGASRVDIINTLVLIEYCVMFWSDGWFFVYLQLSFCPSTHQGSRSDQKMTSWEYG